MDMIAICVECFSDLTELDRDKDHPHVLHCPECGHPNDSPS